MTFFNPTCQGILQIIWSHDEGVTEFFGNKIPEQPENTVRIKINKIYRYFEKVDDKHTRYLQMNDADIGVDMMPETVKNFMLKTKMVKEVPNFKANFERIRPMYEKRVAEKPEFYSKMPLLTGTVDDDEE